MTLTPLQHCKGLRTAVALSTASRCSRQASAEKVSSFFLHEKFGFHSCEQQTDKFIAKKKGQQCQSFNPDHFLQQLVLSLAVKASQIRKGAQNNFRVSRCTKCWTGGKGQTEMNKPAK